MIARLLLVTLLSGSAFSGVESMFGLWAQNRFNWGPHQVGDTFAIRVLVAASPPIGGSVWSKRLQEVRLLAGHGVDGGCCAAAHPAQQGAIAMA